jgi:hypothetical protein
MDRTLNRAEVTDLRRRMLATAEPPLLELGFGTGLNLACYPDRISHITTVDLHPPTLGFVRRRIREARVKVTAEIGNAERLAVHDGSFTTVVTTWLLCSVRNPAAVLSEIRRVLRPGGRYLFIEHGLSGAPAQQRRQERLTPITRITACGCTLTRPIPTLIATAGLECTALEELDVPVLGRASGHLFVGAAKVTPLHLPTRALQAYAALCLVGFCRAKAIRDSTINALVEHLLRLLVEDDLPDWERRGARLELSGRGDAPPPRLLQKLPVDLHGDFAKLVENVVEVGIVNMYGACTSHPADFVLKCVRLLQKHGVLVPDAALVSRAEDGSVRLPEWGQCWTEAQYQEIRALLVEGGPSP